MCSQKAKKKEEQKKCMSGYYCRPIQWYEGRGDYLQKSGRTSKRHLTLLKNVYNIINTCQKKKKKKYNVGLVKWLAELVSSIGGWSGFKGMVSFTLVGGGTKNNLRIGGAPIRINNNRNMGPGF